MWTWKSIPAELWLFQGCPQRLLPLSLAQSYPVSALLELLERQINLAFAGVNLVQAEAAKQLWQELRSWVSSTLTSAGSVGSVRDVWGDIRPSGMGAGMSVTNKWGLWMWALWISCSHGEVWMWFLLSSVSPVLVELSWKTKGCYGGRSNIVLSGQSVHSGLADYRIYTWLKNLFIF